MIESLNGLRKKELRAGWSILVGEAIWKRPSPSSGGPVILPVVMKFKKNKTDYEYKPGIY